MANQSFDINKKVWDVFDVLAGQGIGSTDYLTQFTYLLFLKMDEEASELTGKESRIPEGYRWDSLFVDLSGQDMLPEDQLEQYEDILDTLSSDSNPDAFVRNIFAKAQNKIDNALYLSKVISMIDRVDWFDLSSDVMGSLFVCMLM